MARTNNDTWDLASSVGASATMVAAARAVGDRQRQPFDRRSVRRAAGSGGGHRFFFTRPAGGELDRLQAHTKADHNNPSKPDAA
jgi:hypothetical protein